MSISVSLGERYSMPCRRGTMITIAEIVRSKCPSSETLRHTFSQEMQVYHDSLGHWDLDTLDLDACKELSSIIHTLCKDYLHIDALSTWNPESKPRFYIDIGALRALLQNRVYELEQQANGQG